MNEPQSDAPDKPAGQVASDSQWVELLGGGAAGVGAVLVLFPTLAIVGGVAWYNGSMIVGLPVLAILGIMILLGTLALVAMLFQRLGLTDAEQPLALPPGSMRAAIALSLIVLFAIISITLYLSISEGGKPYRVTGLRDTERTALVTAAAARVLDVYDDACAANPPATPKPDASAAAATPPAAAASAPCADNDRRFAVVLRPMPSADATDLAKQLLVLVGTLMTSVTSFYFAARGGADAARVAGDNNAANRQASSDSSQQQPDGNKPQGQGLGGQADASGTSRHAHDPDDADGCDVAILDATPDEHLPAATGGVAAAKKES